jgi:hypothetical protein
MPGRTTVAGLVPRFSVRPPSLALLAIMALAAMVRWQHLSDVSYDFDEAYTWKMTTFPLVEVWRRTAQDIPPPLYYCSVWIWSRVFGGSPGSLRAMSAMLGVVTVAGAYLLVRQMGIGGSCGGVHHGQALEPGSDSSAHNGRPPEVEGGVSAFVAAVLVALSPMQVDFSQRARMYSLGAALTVTSCWLLLRTLHARQVRWRSYVCYALSAAALAYTHYSGLFVLAAQFVYAVGCIVAEHRVPVASSSRLLPKRAGDDPRLPLLVGSRGAALMAAFVLIAVLYLPWMPSFWRQRQQVAQLYPAEPFSWYEVAKATFQTLAVRWEDEPPSAAVAWGATAVYGLPAAGMVLWGRGGLRLVGLCVLATFDVLICLSVVDGNVIMSRYFVFANVLFLCGLPPLLAGRCRQRSAATNSPRLGLVLGGVLLVAALVGMGWLCLAHGERRERFAQRPGMTAAMEYLADVRQPDEPVIVCNPMLQITAVAHVASAPMNGDRYHSWGHPRAEGEGEVLQIRVLSKHRKFPYFQGTAVMRDEEYLSPDDLAKLRVPGLWAIDAVYWIRPEWKTALPQPWVEVSDVAIPEWVSENAQIIVRRYQTRTTRSGNE